MAMLTAIESKPRPATLRIEAGSATVGGDRSPQRRAQHEQELDRVQRALQAEQGTHSQQLNWLMLSQALLVNAYLLVLVLGWNTPLPGKRWLLAGIALFGAALAVMTYLALRGSRDAVTSLRVRRHEIEAQLHRDFQRTPVFIPHNIFTRGLAVAAVRLLPLAFICGWVAITLYTLGAPLGAAAPGEARVASVIPSSAPRPAARVTAAGVAATAISVAAPSPRSALTR